MSALDRERKGLDLFHSYSTKRTRIFSFVGLNDVFGFGMLHCAVNFAEPASHADLFSYEHSLQWFVSPYLPKPYEAAMSYVPRLKTPVDSYLLTKSYFTTVANQLSARFQLRILALFPFQIHRLRRELSKRFSCDYSVL